MADNESLDEAKFNNLCSHYKDSYDVHLSSRREREIVFYALLFVTAFFSLQITAGDLANGVAADLFKQQGINIDKKSDVFSSLFWLLLFGISAKYYQIHTRIEREYGYLHKLEEKIEAYYADGVSFTREGKSYYNNYPAFSNWIHFLYNFVLPAVIIISTSTRILREGFSTSILHSLLFLSILVSSLIYMWWMHKHIFYKVWVFIRRNF